MCNMGVESSTVTAVLSDIDVYDIVSSAMLFSSCSGITSTLSGIVFSAFLCKMNEY